MNPSAYDLCIEIYGTCSCADAGRAPCDAMVDMAEDGLSSQDERERMEQERMAAEDECGR